MFLDNALNLIILTIKAASARRINLIQANVRFKIVLRQRNWIKKHVNANVEGDRDDIATPQTFMTLKNVNVMQGQILDEKDGIWFDSHH